MSASLVGSEMCIRDRPQVFLYAASVGQGHMCNATSATAHETAGNRREPVSYTHLTLPTICSV
eukprot:4173468-Alexandrium_andersonii.AAC.1